MKNPERSNTTFALVLVACLVVITAATFAQTPAPSPFTLKPLGHNAYAAITTAGAGAGGNAGVVIGDDGVLVVDTFQRVEPARALLAEIRKLTPLPIKYVVNTHYHYDHVTGNSVFAEAGAVVIAHRNVRDWINTENEKFYGANITAEQKAAVAALKPPTLVYTDEIDLFLGKRQVVAHYFPGHTGGDTMLFDPESNTVFCGDMFWRHTLPNLIDATTSAWIETLDAMIQHHPAAHFVSGHGDVGTIEDVKAFRGYLVDLRQWISDARRSGATGDAIVDAVVPKIKDKYGDWASFNNFSRNNVIQTAAELNGDKKIPRPSQQ